MNMDHRDLCLCHAMRRSGLQCTAEAYARAPLTVRLQNIDPSHIGEGLRYMSAECSPGDSYRWIFIPEEAFLFDVVQ